MLRRRRQPSISNTTYSVTGGGHSGPASEYPGRHLDAAIEQATAYEAQRQELLAELADDPTSPYVPKCVAVQRQDGTGYTVTTWSEGVPALLPAADVIRFIELLPGEPDFSNGAGPITEVRWDVTAEHLADEHWVVRPDLRPTRVLVERFPTADVMDELKRRSLP